MLILFRPNDAGCPGRVIIMRLIRDFVRGPVRVSVFSWNNKYLLKLEAGNLEQTFKVDELDFTSDEEALQLLNDRFMERAIIRFNDMAEALYEARREAND